MLQSRGVNAEHMLHRPTMHAGMNSETECCPSWMVPMDQSINRFISLIIKVAYKQQTAIYFKDHKIKIVCTVHNIRAQLKGKTGIGETK